MDTTIYYFSGTGNSLAVARELGNKLGGCKIKSIAECVKNREYTADTSKIGFVFPLYYYSLPLIVEEFLESIDLNRAEYIFFVETRGGVWSPECTAGDMKRLLAGKGKALSAGFKIIMPNNFIKRGYKLNSSKVTEEKLRNAVGRIAELAQKISSGQKGIEGDPFITSGLARLVHNSWKRKVYRSDGELRVDESCSSCGICEMVCPVNNVVLVEGKPHWQHNCQECLACVHFCLQAAILCGQKSDNKLRYHHPEVSVKDMSCQN